MIRAKNFFWLRLVIVAALVTLAYYTREEFQPGQPPRQDISRKAAERSTSGSTEELAQRSTSPDAIEIERQAGRSKIPPPESQAPDWQPEVETLLKNITIRDMHGKVVFRGDVDVSPTLQRIHEDRLLRFRNDGSVFENRERRLPIRPRGHYREYVHPTPDLEGPGPQRIVVGQSQEVYYTHDHYRTFKRLDRKR